MMLANCGRKLAAGGGLVLVGIKIRDHIQAGRAGDTMSEGIFWRAPAEFRWRESFAGATKTARAKFKTRQQNFRRASKISNPNRVALLAAQCKTLRFTEGASLYL